MRVGFVSVNMNVKRSLLVLAMRITMTLCQQYQDVDFALERPVSLPSITQLEVMCGQDHMTVQLSFSKLFHGMVFSKGQYGRTECVYVEPFSSGTHFEFKIYYNKCGTKPDLGGRFYENTVIVQYDADLIEVWDEAKRLRCEWYNDYEKTASKPPMVIADLEAVELNFRGDNVDCWMEIQDGKGPWAGPVTGIVPLGSTLTMVVAINDKAAQFDMRVKSCEASDGKNSPIYLSDEEGCVLRPKMISKFMKVRNNDRRATVITYAYFHAFKFPDSMSVFMRCKVEICRYGCPDHCPDVGVNNLYDTFRSRSDYGPNNDLSNGTFHKRMNKENLTEDVYDEFNDETPDFVATKEDAEKYLASNPDGADVELPKDGDFPWGPRSLRKKRSVVLSRHTREANIGVDTRYQVISEADLEFALTKTEDVTVFKGKLESIIYGICLPAPGFSALFVLIAMCTVISVLVAGFMCHHRQIQKDTTESPAVPHQQSYHFTPSHMIQFLRSQISGGVN